MSVAKVTTPKLVDRAIKCVVFEKRSTITHIAVFPAEKGKYVINSMEMSCQAMDISVSGCSSPYGLCVGDLICWLVPQLRMKAVTYVFSFGHKKMVDMRFMVGRVP